MAQTVSLTRSKSNSLFVHRTKRKNKGIKSQLLINDNVDNNDKKNHDDKDHDNNDEYGALMTLHLIFIQNITLPKNSNCFATEMKRKAFQSQQPVLTLQNFKLEVPCRVAKSSNIFRWTMCRRAKIPKI